MFTEEMDTKIRNYAPPPVSERKKQKELKQQQKMERRIEKEAQYLWNKLKELYESHVPYFAENNLNGHPIKFMITNRRGYNPHYVYYFLGYESSEYLLSKKRIMYPLSTLERLKEIALDNGLDVYKHRHIPSFQDLRRAPERREYHYQFRFPKHRGRKGTFYNQSF